MTIAQGKHEHVYKNIRLSAIFWLYTSSLEGSALHILILIWANAWKQHVMTKDEIIYIVTLIFVCLGYGCYYVAKRQQAISGWYVADIICCELSSRWKNSLLCAVTRAELARDRENTRSEFATRAHREYKASQAAVAAHTTYSFKKNADFLSACRRLLAPKPLKRMDPGFWCCFFRGASGRKII